MAKDEGAVPVIEVHAQPPNDAIASTKRPSVGVMLEVPDDVTEIAVEGQRFRVEAGVVEIPHALGEAARAHIDSLVAAARLTVERLERDVSSASRAALRKAWKIVRDTMDRELDKAP